LFQYRVKALYGTAELERMKQGYREIKIALRWFVARGGEVDLSQLLAIPMLLLLRHSRRRDGHQQDRRDDCFPVQWRLRP
jgi:hypothetical protein